MPFLTVLCPLYNHAPHFAMTLATIASQTFRDFNVICRDDCGPQEEEYRAVIDKFNDLMPNPIQYIRAEKNEGIGVNRQKLLEAADGEYVIFIDDDDQFYSVEAFQIYATNILQQRQQGHICDMARARFMEAHEDGVRLLHEMNEGAWVHAVMFRRAFLNDNKIVFPDYRCYEDGALMHIATRMAGFTVFIDAPTYLWCWTTNSLTRSQDYLHVMLPTYTDSFWRAYKFLEPIKGKDNILELLIAPLCHSYFYLMGVERRYPETDDYIVRTYKILQEIIDQGKILEVIDDKEDRFNQFRLIYAGARNGAVGQDPMSFESITFNDWLQLHFGRSIKKLEVPKDKNFVYRPSAASMYADRDKKKS